ncbi:T9SS sorting signal type C domain-containing protein [Flavobacterium sp. PL02]|uniref:T9SS sorting signal type C domain-containing protein n=1 Tax=Flavobacterium sp. PL02 TaxID=3088354 RepID=UPI002B23009F|nr:T9SS sorting signal type C domain-containing protein [Flavobacterium sp. PL02]MEA9411498.1 T9SS sorting signal type C domain-containing protein [Flavobacterium sp. PL02]
MKLKLFLLLVFISSYSWSQAGSTKTYTNNGTFPVPAGITSVIVQAWGGGGSGGGASGAPLLLGRGAAGGGGGAYASAPITVTPGATLNVLVASQTAGTSGTGAAGGNSTISGFETSILAAGGLGGDANNAGGSPAGGTGGTIAASAGSSKFAGVNGGNGNSWNLLGLLLSSGAGGAGANSGGAGGGAVSGLLLSNAPGIAGSPAGGGGSGAINSALGVAQIGGAGAAGKVIISYSCPNYSIASTTAASICASSGTTSTITLAGSVTSLPVGNYVVTYNRSSPSATALTANLAVSTAGTGTFTAEGLTTAGSSIITVTKLTSETCSSTITTNNSATVIVSPATVGGTVSGGTTINAGNTSGLLTLSGHTGVVIKWQSAVSPFTTWVDIVNTNTTYTSGTLTATTQFRAVVQSGACVAANSAATTVTVVPLPTITGLAANSVCTSDDAQSTALSYSATTGAPITYSIVWNSSPANSFAAVTDEVLPSSPITIAVPAEAAAGTYTGTLTVKNASGGISTGSVFTVTINETPTIISDGVLSLICANGNSQTSTLFYVASFGNPTSYALDWNNAANAALLADIPDTSYNFASSGGIPIQIPANALPGTYNGSFIVKSGSCSSASTVTITIIGQAIGGTVTGGTTINSGETSGLLTLSGHTGSVVKWQSSVSPFTAWVDIDNTNTTYTSGVLTETTQFRAVVRTGFCPVVNSAATTVTVEALPTITASASAGSRCSIVGAQNTPLSYSETTGSPISYSIVWDSSPANSFAAVTDAALPSSPITIAVPAGTAVGTYTGTLTVKNANGGVSTGSIFTVTINEIPKITSTRIFSAICAGSQISDLAYSATTGSPTSYAVNWDNEANAAFLVDIPDTPHLFTSTPNTFQIEVSANALPGTYQGSLILKNGSCGSVYPVSITIYPPTVGGTVTGGTTITSGNTSGLLTLSGHTGSVVNWQSSVNPFTTWVDIANTNTTYTSGVLTETTQFRAVVQSGDCAVVNSVATTVTVEDLPTITISDGTFPICPADEERITNLYYSETTGSPVTYSIVWDSSPANSFAAVTDAALPESPIDIHVPAGTVGGSYTGTLTVKNASGVVSTGSSFTVPINEKPTITTNGTISPVFTSTNSQTASLTYTAVTGDPIGYYIEWDVFSGNSPMQNQGTTSFTFAPGGGVINTIEVSPNVPPGTYIGSLVIYNGTCISAAQEVSIVINPEAPTITAAESTNAVCSRVSAQGAALSYSATTGSPVSYSIVWDSSPTNSFAAVTDAALPASPIKINVPGGTAEGTYTGTLTVKNASGVSSAGSLFTVTVNPLPTITTNGEITPVFTSTSSQTTLLAYTAVTGNPTEYSVKWNVISTNSPIQNQGLTPFTAAPGGGVINTIEISPNVPSGTYVGLLTIYSGTCKTDLAVTIQVNDVVLPPTITAAESTNAVCSRVSAQGAALSYSATTGSPVSYSIVWDSSPTNSFAAVTDVALPASPIKINVPGGTAEGTYTGTLTVKNASGVSSAGSLFTVTVNPLPTITTNGEITPVFTSTSSQTTSLAYTAVTGNPTEYSVKWNVISTNSPIQNQGLTPFTAAPGGGVINTIEISPNVPSGTYVGLLTIYSGTCKTDLAVTIVVNDAVVPPTITGIGATDICSSPSAQNTTFYLFTTGSPVVYSIVWDSSPTNSFAAVTDEALIDNTVTVAIPAGTAAGVYNGALTVKNANGISSSSSLITVTINETPAVTPTVTPETSSSKGSVLLENLPEGDWTVSFNSGATVYESDLPSLLIQNLSSGTYTFIITSDQGCVQELTVGIPFVFGRAVASKYSASANNTISVATLNKVISVNAFDQNINQVLIYDVSGNLLYQKDGVGNPKLSIDNLKSANQVLVVKVVLDNNQIKIKKVIY